MKLSKDPKLLNGIFGEEPTILKVGLILVFSDLAVLLSPVTLGHQAVFQLWLFPLTAPLIGYRKNELEESLSILKRYISPEDFEKLQFTRAPEALLEATKLSTVEEI